VSHSDGFKDFDYSEDVAGVRIVYSDGWDSTNSHPQGAKNATDHDPFTNDSSFDGEYRDNSYNKNLWSSGGMGAWMFEYRPGSSRTDLATNYQTNYFISARNDGVSLGCWSSNSSFGGSCYFSYENTSGKFWSDGIKDFTVMNRFNKSNGSNGATSYGFQYTSGNVSNDYNGHPTDEMGIH
jgi:hypothetical protein